MKEKKREEKVKRQKKKSGRKEPQTDLLLHKAVQRTSL